MNWRDRPLLQSVFLLIFTSILALYFARLEIQIEGAHGWAANLPTWRIEKHWLLDIFWGGRALTGYHAWAFSFMALVFHLPVFIMGCWTPYLEFRILGSLMWFWIVEDFLWFIFNPAFGWAKFSPEHVPWHKHWLGPVPTDYVTFMAVGILLLVFSFRAVANPGVSPGASAPSPVLPTS